MKTILPYQTVDQPIAQEMRKKRKKRIFCRDKQVPSKMNNVCNNIPISSLYPEARESDSDPNLDVFERFVNKRMLTAKRSGTYIIHCYDNFILYFFVGIQLHCDITKSGHEEHFRRNRFIDQ